jgi:hypothetical protein
MAMMRTIDQLFENSTFTVEDVAEQANLTAERVEAIAMGRWTPGPKERQAIAAVFEVQVESISWGHTMDPRNIRYRQYGMKKDP